MSISLPIVIVEGLDVSLHPSIEDAERALEPWWVEQHEGGIYDAAGNCLSAEVVTEQSRHSFPLGARSRKKVHITVPIPLVNASENLRLALIRHLVTSGAVLEKALVQEETLSALVARVVNFRLMR